MENPDPAKVVFSVSAQGLPSGIEERAGSLHEARRTDEQIDVVHRAECGFGVGGGDQPEAFERDRLHTGCAKRRYRAHRCADREAVAVPRLAIDPLQLAELVLAQASILEVPVDHGQAAEGGGVHRVQAAGEILEPPPCFKCGGRGEQRRAERRPLRWRRLAQLHEPRRLSRAARSTRA